MKNIIDEIYIPNKIKDKINGLEYITDSIGLSNSKVFIFDDYILKISKLPFDIDNEVRIYQILKDKLPIPEIIDYVVENNTIYLLKTKLKGKLLSDSYYMERPDLLYKLAVKAIKMLWSIDIKDLNLKNTYDVIIKSGKFFYDNNLLDFKNTDNNITKDFKSFDEIFDYLAKNNPNNDNVLCHGDLCLPNIICNGNKLVGFIDLGLMGISNRYHDLAILYRSIKYNFNGSYGKSYQGFNENKLFDLLEIKKDEKLLKYYLLLDEVLG